ncbi:hypothetical protein AMJ40_02880 [candidate division TA06 bacterium DG_26]|uniref:ACT domain-containing protein n=1 Tax=candidate division TA06 bacterium DG_26 TaxID=1703771 RepID=A0A0S7WLI1_UNCT6|nr:MAG: hypothetical protein AMJ40_02880 [candidate division TA06 bacterium DG_26]
MNGEKLRDAYQYVSDSIGYEEFASLASQLKLPYGKEAGFTSRELAAYVSLLQKVKDKPDSVHVDIVIEEKDRRSFATVTVLAPDWAGLLDSVVSVIHERGYNLEYLQGFLTRGGRYAVITVSLELSEKLTKRFLEEKATLEKLLKSMARSDRAIMKLLRGEARKLQKYREVIAILHGLCSADEIAEIVGSEAERFFASRPGAYIEERKPDDLAKQILTNYRFQREVEAHGGVKVSVSNIETSKELLTAVSVVGLDREIALDDVLQGLREFLVDFQRKYDKEFVTDQGVAVFRVEIQTAEGTWLEEGQLTELELMLTEKLKQKQRRVPLEVRMGAELFGRLAIPQLLKEAAISQKPQVYIFPELSQRDSALFKILLVAPVKDKKAGELAISCVNRLNRITGLSVTSTTQPIAREGREVDIIDVKADTTIFEESEDIYGTIKDCLREEIGDFRDFDEGLRVLDVKRLKELTEMLAAQGVDSKFVRNFYYNTEDFFRVSAPEVEIAAHITLGWRAYRQFRKVKEKIVKGANTENASLFCVVDERDKMDIDMYLAPLREYELLLTRIDEPGAVVLLFRVGKDNRGLSGDEVERLLALFAQ